MPKRPGSDEICSKTPLSLFFIMVALEKVGNKYRNAHIMPPDSRNFALTMMRNCGRDGFSSSFRCWSVNLLQVIHRCNSLRRCRAFNLEQDGDPCQSPLQINENGSQKSV